ncbi:MAG TPA: EamA family transporter [Desulfotignum sp.]|nr:EamA family transporter [Desulfotignum sp.]
MQGSLFLFLAVVFSSGVALSMKAANIRRVNLWQFLAVNYVVCTGGLLAWGAWKTLLDNPPFVWGLGLFTGGMYVLCLWLFNKAITAGGLALSTTLMRLSAAVPTLGSLIFFKETAGYVQAAGIALAFLSLPLAGNEPLRLGRGIKNAVKGVIWGLLLFAAYGITDFVFKIQAELAPAADHKAFMATIFGTALVLTLPRLVNGGRISRPCLTWGATLGITNVLATYFWIQALSHLPGSMAYPTLGLGVIAVTTLFSLLLWKEPLRPANYLFLAMACTAVFLINMG